MNILITNIGRRGYLVDFIKSTQNFNGKVYVSDCDWTASGLYGCNDGNFILSRPVDDEKKYINELLNLCEKEQINIIIPVIDPEIYILSEYRNLFIDKNIMVLVSERSVLDICYNKVKMNDFLRENQFQLVKTYLDLEDFETAYKENIISYPVFVKPILGSGSVNSKKVCNKEELIGEFGSGMMIQEYLEGQEYGVDVFVDWNYNPVRAVVKQKLSMRSGETDKALSVKNKAIQMEVIRMVKSLKAFGPVDTDVIVTHEGIYIIDINPRFGGGYPATHLSGVNFIELVLKLYNKEEIVTDYDNYIEGQLVMKEVGLKTININN